MRPIDIIVTWIDSFSASCHNNHKNKGCISVLKHSHFGHGVIRVNDSSVDKLKTPSVNLYC